MIRPAGMSDEESDSDTEFMVGFVNYIINNILLVA